MNELIIALIIFIFIIVAMVILRVKLSEKFEVKNSDILIAIIPIILWFLLTGKVKNLEIGGVKIEGAFVEASKTAVVKQITPVKLPVETVRMDPKKGIEQIPYLIKNKTEALLFELGYGGYYGAAIEEYLQRLSQYPFFKYVIIVDRGKRFVGISDARELNSILQSRQATFNSYDFEKWLNMSQTSQLSRLPKFMGANDAIRKDTHKQTALEKMEALNIEMLPVIDKMGRFVGVVDRSRLTSSLIIDVAKRLNQDK
jgi:hypothetical protein